MDKSYHGCECLSCLKIVMGTSGSRVSCFVIDEACHEKEQSASQGDLGTAVQLDATPEHVEQHIANNNYQLSQQNFEKLEDAIKLGTAWSISRAAKDEELRSYCV